MASVGSSNEAVDLYVTPMLDIFSILIVFLLMSFSTDPVSHDVNENIELPRSMTMVSLDEIPTIVATKDSLFVNDKKVAAIFGGDVEEKDRSQGAIYPLYEELKKLFEANKRTLKRAGTTPKPANSGSTITMEMDQEHKFKLMKRIMLTAQQAEFITFKLMVEKENS